MEDITEKGQASPKEVLVGEKPPIYITFTMHGKEDKEFLPAFREQTERLLDKYRTGKIVVLLELAGVEKGFSDFLEREFDNGAKIKPIYLAHNSLMNGELPTQENLVTREGKMNQDPIQSFRLAELEMVDDLNVQYPGRLKLIFEGSGISAYLKVLPRLNESTRDLYNRITPQVNEVVEQAQKENKIPDIGGIIIGVLYETAQREFLRGERRFLIAFRAMLDFFSKYNVAREDAVTPQLIDAAENPETAAIFVHFGAGHTRIAHTLKREGFDVKVDFEGKPEKGKFSFPPQASLLRSLQFNPDRPISELELTQGLIGNLLAGVIMAERKIVGGKRYQGVIRTVDRVIRKKLDTEAKVEDFMLLIKEIREWIITHRQIIDNNEIDDEVLTQACSYLLHEET